MTNTIGSVLGFSETLLQGACTCTAIMLETEGSSYAENIITELRNKEKEEGMLLIMA